MKWLQVLVSTAVLGALVTSAASAQVVFSEIRYKDASGSAVNQVVELKNTSVTAVDIGSWVICHQFTYNAVFPAGTTIPAGGFLLAHFNQTGINTATDVFFSGSLATVTDVALYDVSNQFTNASHLKAFVQFGGHPGSGREDVAASAGLWTVGTFIPAVGNGQSIELCAADPTLPNSYVPQPNPTLGQPNACGVPVKASSWSVLKSVFR